MQLDLKQVFQQEGLKLPFDWTLDLSAQEVYGALPFPRPVAITGTVENQDSVVRLRYHAVVEYQRECDRCLDPHTEVYKLDFEHMLTGDDQGDGSDELVCIPDFRLDFDELAREDIVLEMPTKHLCRQECKGLCPKCGCNLNHSQCGCDLSEPDPRLAALNDLLEMHDKEG